ncbi:MAG: metallopeptidase family protein [Tepidisphaeraceae bacterium]
MPVRVERQRLEQMIEAAIASLPDQFRSALDVVRIELRDRPTRRQLRSVGLADDELLLGLYEGTPLTERHIDDTGRLPDVIYLFHEDLEDACDSEDEFQSEVRITLLHELGHYFGFDEDQLDALGYG